MSVKVFSQDRLLKLPDLQKTKLYKSIEEALKEADEKGIKGKDVTPFLLSHIKKLTDGKSLESNIKLVLNNAKLAAEIGVELEDS